jgi:intracellular septation protein
VKSLLSEQISVPEPVWDRLMSAWVAFFGVLGVINLAVAYTVSTEAWVNFKLFGLFGLTLAFMLVLGLYLSRHMKEEATDA